MARSRKSGILSVILNGRLIGTLEQAASGAISFLYNADWLTDSRAMPISLSLPLREERYSGEPVRAVFENLLPDNDAILRKVAERTGADGIDAFSLLSKIGRDCVGALQFLPKDEKALPPSKPEGVSIDEAEIAERIRNLGQVPLGVGRDNERNFRISIAGAQEKTAFLWNKGWQLPIGITPTTHIFKPQIGKLNNGLDLRQSVENEHFCLTLCRELGLETAHTTILDFEDVRVLSITRFDRLWAQDGRLLRLPQEDFCQALSIPPTLKYDSSGGPGIRECLSLLNGSDYADKDSHSFIKSQILFWLMGATDGHAKNFSIFLTPGGRFRMTPLYDVLSAQPNLDAGQLRRREFKLAMAAGHRRNYPIYQIHPRHFEQSAQAAGLATAKVRQVLEFSSDNLDGALERTLKTMPTDFPQEISNSISEAMRKRLFKLV